MRNTSSFGITPAYSLFGTTLQSSPARVGAGGLGIADAFNVSSEFNTAVSGGTVGLFGDVAERPSLFALTPATAWNMGGSLGYAGFYLRAGVSGTPQLGPFQRTQGWQAGLGFASRSQPAAGDRAARPAAAGAAAPRG